MNKHKYCLDCGKEIFNHGKSIRCHSCANIYRFLIHPAPKRENAFNYKHGKTFNNRCYICNKLISYTAKQCLQCFRNRPSKGKNYPHCIECGKKLGDYLSIKCKSCVRKGKKLSQKTKQKIKESKLGRKNPMFGIPSPQGKQKIYKNIKLRNSWEVKYAQYLDKNNIEWEYEYKTFDLGESTYTPDFYLPERDAYIEIKGFWRTKDKKKFKLFKTIYTSIQIIVLQEKELKLLKILK